jgi:hypothetical protein
MNYADLSLIELKQIAKQRRYIKRYYVKSKEELITILSLPAPPREMILEKLTIKALREEAKQRGYKGRGVWDMHRGDLMTLLYPPAPHQPLEKTPADKDEKDERNADEHDDPEEHHPE